MMILALAHPLGEKISTRGISLFNPINVRRIAKFISTPTDRFIAPGKRFISVLFCAKPTMDVTPCPRKLRSRSRFQMDMETISLLLIPSFRSTARRMARILSPKMPRRDITLSIIASCNFPPISKLPIIVNQRSISRSIWILPKLRAERTLAQKSQRNIISMPPPAISPSAGRFTKMMRISASRSIAPARSISIGCNRITVIMAHSSRRVRALPMPMAF